MIMMSNERFIHLTMALLLWAGGAAACSEDGAESVADASTCVDPAAAYPISSSLETGPTSSAFYDTVSPFEYADMERTHVHRADFYGATDGSEVSVTSSRYPGTYENPYNIVTRERDEAFLYVTDPVPYIVKIDVATQEPVWRTDIPVLEDNFNWVGLVAVHGNGDVYAVHARTLVRLDAATGAIVARADLPPPAGSEARDTVYNGFTIAPNGLIVGKSYGRPAGCEESGTDAIINCVSEDNPQPPSAIITLDPDTLAVLSAVDLPAVATGRPAVAQYSGETYLYLNGADDVFRLRLSGSELILDEDWRLSGFLADGQSGSSSVVVLGDWVAFQTNGTPARSAMTVHVVSQADDDVSATFDLPPPELASFTPSSLTADPVSMAIYAQDGGAGHITRLDFDESAVTLSENWMIQQSTIQHVTLIGPPEERVLVGTDAPESPRGFIMGSYDYQEEVVWRSAATGDELARSDALPAMHYGGPVTPGFDGVLFYLGMDGSILELSPMGPEPVCD